MFNNVNERSRVKRPMSTSERNRPTCPGVNSPTETERLVTHSGRMTRRSRWKSGLEIEVKSNAYWWWVSTTARSCRQTSRNDKKIVIPSSSLKIRWRISTGNVCSDGIKLFDIETLCWYLYGDYRVIVHKVTWIINIFHVSYRIKSKNIRLLSF